MNADYPAEHTHLMVVADSSGKIIAAALEDSRLHGTKDLPKVSVHPAEGQKIHRIALPQGTEREGVLSALGAHMVKIEGDKATLIRK